MCNKESSGESVEGNHRRCISLGKRMEFREGCNGWLCAHRCLSTETEAQVHLDGKRQTIPGRKCITCPAFVDDGPF